MRLLIVASDRHSRRSLSHLLTEEGHTVSAAPSEKEGLARLEGERFDLVVAALSAPRPEGMKMLRTVRRRWPETPLVVLSASPKVEATVEAMGVGPVEYVRTPVGKDEVQAVLERIVERLPTRSVPRKLPTELRGPSTLAPLGTPLAHELGEGRLELSLSEMRVQKVLRIDATAAPPNLLSRLLVGSYITGQDQVLITAHGGLTTAQRDEIHQLVDRTLGMSVVGDSPEVVEIQNFVDPGKHELPRLLHRVVQMLRTEIEVCRVALATQEAPQLSLIDTIEEEVDRFYLLMVRQLLLSSDNPRVARNIDVESHHYQIGYRLVAKVLEVTGDLLHGIGAELQGNLPGLRHLPRTLTHELVRRLERLDHLLTRTMDAFDRLSVVDANATLNLITEALPKDADLAQRLCRRIPNRKVAVAAQRIAYHLDMALEMLIIVNEVTINRSVEPETVARTGTRVPMSSRPPPSSPRPSGPSRSAVRTPRGGRSE